MSRSLAHGRYVAIIITRQSLERAAAALILAAASGASLLGAWLIVLGAGPSRPGPLVARPVAAEPLDITQPIFTVPGAPRAMAFAVNVDWGEEFLPALLDVLAARGVRITFFPTGRWAEKNPELMRRLAAAGHELGNHGSHHAHPAALDEAALVRLVVEGAAAVRRLTGQTTRLFAPPYGEWNAAMVQKVASVGHYTVLWTLDTIDWQRPAPERIVQRVLPRAQAGGIVLMHPTAPTLAALPALIDGLRTQGFQLMPVGELIDRARRLTP